MKKTEETELRKAFNTKWCAIMHESPEKGVKEKMWIRLLQRFDTGFKCAYCGVSMKIRGGIDSFSLDHKDNNNRFNLSADDLEIVCTGCNLFKRSISKGNFLKIISSFFAIHGELDYNEIKLELYEGVQKGIRQARAEGKICHRPRKEVDIARVKKYIKKGVPLTEIAVIEKVGLSTLRTRITEENRNEDTS